MVKISVITPTIGRASLRHAIESVKSQKLQEGVFIQHIVVFDGPKCREKYESTLAPEQTGGRLDWQILPITLPFSTGKDGSYGQKIMGAGVCLTDADWVCFLDDDNTFDENHLQSCLDASKGKDWVFSLRKIFSKGEYIEEDLFESLGPYKKNYSGENDILIDNNCYFLKRELALSLGKVWNSGWGADRLMARILCTQYPNFSCTFLHTVNYEMDPKHLRLENNRPVKDAVYVFHLTPDATKKAIAHWIEYQKCQRECLPEEEPCYDPLLGQKQWQQNFFLGAKFNICDGFELWKYAPSGSKFFFVVFDQKIFPPGAYERKDVEKILYFAESPNRNYIHNWDESFLKNFDRIISCWENADVFLDPKKHEIRPFVNKFNFCSSETEALFPETEKEESICCVLQNRSTEGKYEIRGIKLWSLDYLRFINMKRLEKWGNKVVCYGPSWRNSGLPFRETKDRFLDQEPVIDIYKKHKWVYISENTNAKGYMSEKIYDALAAGCIPIYVCSEKTHSRYYDLLKKVAIVVGYEENISEVFSHQKDFVPKRKDVVEFLKLGSIDRFLNSTELGLAQ